MSQIRAAALIEMTLAPLVDAALAQLPPVWQTARYTLSFARTAADVEAAQRLRFAVFNQELGEGLADSWLSGRDEDRFDAQCLHLLVRERASDAVVGTYRLQTSEHARAGHGFYAATEFDLQALPAAVLADALELGRACIAQPHRHSEVFLLLWRGIAAYLQASGKRYLFGCCSLPGQNPEIAWAAARQLAAAGQQHRNWWVSPQPAYVCPAAEPHLDAVAASVELPKLLRCYLRFGAQICSPPAVDRQFNTIDFLVLLDADALPERTWRMLGTERPAAPQITEKR